MKACPCCAEQIQNEAVKCRYCGEFFPGHSREAGMAPSVPYPAAWGYEYRSEAAFLGLPLVHIANGFDPATGRPRVARGVIAIAPHAIGSNGVDPEAVRWLERWWPGIREAFPELFHQGRPARGFGTGAP